MTRPTVLIATTQPAMAYALGERLKTDCRKLGLRLENCPDGDDVEDEAMGVVQVYASAEALFEVLEKRNPMDLADMLVVLDVGALLTGAFEPHAPKDESWHVTGNSAGVAVELLLRFPQVFPVFLSPLVPVVEMTSNTAEEVLSPGRIETHEAEWGAFHRLQESLCRIEELPHDLSHAFSVPLHFVSPLDSGHGLFSTISRFARGMRCWFDPTGLRTLVKCRFLGTLFGNATNWDNTREQREVLSDRLDNVAVAIDEEREFAMLNAYTAYKFGRRAWIITTFAEFDTKPLWVAQAMDVTQNLDVVVLRDIDLRFPDIPEKDKIREKLANVNESVWENKYGACWRIRAVSSHPYVETEIKFGAKHSDDEYRLGQYGEFPDFHYLGRNKPISTMYDLIRLVKEKVGNEYQTINSRLKTVKDPSVDGGHGAPYLNLAMAESLLQQTGNCERGPVENLLGALLAGEAYELLLGMSRTTALEALMLMHKKEVAAETGFPGVSQNMKLSVRKSDVEASLEMLFVDDTSKNPENARTTKNLFLSRFWADLRPVYRDAELFEPAEAANRESLIAAQWVGYAWISRLFFIQKLKGLLIQIATGLFSLFIATLVIWAILTFFYAWGDGYHLSLSWDGIKNWLNLFKDVMLTSLALQPTDTLPKLKSWWKFLLVLHVSLSYMSFGLLISNLHRKITRS
jgi:hypothetical protein